MPTRSSRPLFALVAFPLVVVALLGAAFAFRDLLLPVFGSAKGLRAAVEGAGPWGPALFVGLQIVQVVVFVLPGEIVQIAGGYLFGALEGTLLSVLGIAIGSMLDFAAARLLGTRFVAALFGNEKLERFDALMASKRAEVSFFLLFVIPGIPKDLLCFVGGLSAMRPATFLAVSMIGRLPGIAGSAVMGAAASDGRPGLFAAVALVAAVLFVAGLLARDSIHDAVSSIARGKGRRAAPGEKDGA